RPPHSTERCKTISTQLTKTEQHTLMVLLRKQTLLMVVLTAVFVCGPELFLMLGQPLLPLPYLIQVLTFWLTLNTCVVLGLKWVVPLLTWQLVKCSLVSVLVQWAWIGLIVLWSNWLRS